MSSRKLSILVVDDEPEVGEILSAVFEDEGHTALACRSGLEAFMKLQRAPHPFDVIVTDHFMPGSLDGAGLARVVRAKGYATPILVMSGRLSPELKEAYKPFRVFGFLHKPFDLKLLRVFLEAISRASPTPAVAAIPVSCGTSWAVPPV